MAGSMPQPRRAPLALLLTGGGARTAYQAGVLQAIAEWLPAGAPVPFEVVCGTSAGAINAALLAADAQDFAAASHHLAGVWRHLRTQQVLHTGALRLYGRALRWVAPLVGLRLGKVTPRSLLDASPLRSLLERHVNFARLEHNVSRGLLRAVSVTAAGYASGRSITFVATRESFTGWRRARRIGVASRITLDHVLASAALPFLFEAVRTGEEFCGDGAMRDLAPLSAPIHLGAERILVITTRNEDPPAGGKRTYPTIGRIAGTLLDALFSDSLRTDLERLRQTNQMLAQMPGEALDETGRVLRPIRVMVMAPSADPRALARTHQHRLARPLRNLLRGIGATRQGSPLVSYLLFDGAYCADLIALGRADATARREALRAFLEAPA
jgi:NTE family protein